MSEDEKITILKEKYNTAKNLQDIAVMPTGTWEAFAIEFNNPVCETLLKSHRDNMFARLIAYLWGVIATKDYKNRTSCYLASGCIIHEGLTKEPRGDVNTGRWQPPGECTNTGCSMMGKSPLGSFAHPTSTILWSVWSIVKIMRKVIRPKSFKTRACQENLY